MLGRINLLFEPFKPQLFITASRNFWVRKEKCLSEGTDKGWDTVAGYNFWWQTW